MNYLKANMDKSLLLQFSKDEASIKIDATDIETLSPVIFGKVGVPHWNRVFSAWSYVFGIILQLGSWYSAMDAWYLGFLVAYLN